MAWWAGIVGALPTWAEIVAAVVGVAAFVTAVGVLAKTKAARWARSHVALPLWRDAVEPAVRDEFAVVHASIDALNIEVAGLRSEVREDLASMRRRQTRQEKVARQVLDRLDTVVAELQPNHGSTARDAAVRLSDSLVGDVLPEGASMRDHLDVAAHAAEKRAEADALWDGRHVGRRHDDPPSEGQVPS